ncbi:MAG: ABC transporter substrate-binding protein [Pseudomonadota bacterium]|nr:ABC transporter substrate-binding protein [Pseudomonadota bacterium]
MRRVLLIVLGLLIAWPAGGAAPRRVVSFNLCADQLVVALADPEQIAGLSPYAADPNLSVVADKAHAFRRIDWQAEATIALSPDLVFVGSWDRSATRRMLRKLGFRTMELDLAPDLASARKQIADVAAALGHPERGEQLIAALDAARARLDAVRLPYRTALVLERGGFTAGPESLAATLLATAGLKPPSGAPSGFGGFLPLEKLLVLRPDLIFLKDPPAQPSDQGALFFTHPALQALYPASRRIALPTRYTVCGGPALVAAFDYLAEALTRLAGKD